MSEPTNPTKPIVRTLKKVQPMAQLQDKDYRGILAGVLVGGTLTLAAVSMVTDKEVPAWEAFLTLTGMAVAWYFSNKQT